MKSRSSGGAGRAHCAVVQRDVHVWGLVVEAPSPDEVVTSHVVTALDERAPRTHRGGFRTRRDHSELRVAEVELLIHGLTVGRKPLQVCGPRI